MRSSGEVIVTASLILKALFLLTIKQQKPENSALCEHVILLDHVIEWANSQILKTESNFSKRFTAESWFILSRPKVINRSDSESFSIVYRSLL